MVELKLHYVTNRNHIGEKQRNPDGYGSGFSDDGAENLRFVKATVQADEQQISNYLNAETIDKGNWERHSTVRVHGRTCSVKWQDQCLCGNLI